MATSLMQVDELPFRFWLSPAMAARWRGLAHAEQQDMLSAWAEELPSLTLSGSGIATDQVAVRGALCFVRSTCVLCGITLADAVASFSAYATKRLRSGSAVRGELELTAEWAEATGAQRMLEVPCAAGRIDIVFPQHSLLVEAKLAGSWKHALGQALSYRYCLGKSYSAALLLLGSRVDPVYDGRLAEAVAAENKVHVFWYNGLTGTSSILEQWQKFTSLRENRNK